MKRALIAFVASAAPLTPTPAIADEVDDTTDGVAMHVKLEQSGDCVSGKIARLKPGIKTNAKIGQEVIFDIYPTRANRGTGHASGRNGVMI